MTDILDIIDELDDENLDFDDDSFEEDDTPLEGVILEDEIGYELEETGQMNESDARAITDTIVSATAAVHILLSRAHEYKAHKALGYATWADYVKEEFGRSPQSSYQLINQARVIAMIEDVVPEGTIVKLTEAQARDIKQQLPAITEHIKHETRDKSPEEAADDIDRIIEETREQSKADAKAVEDKQKSLDDDELEARNQSLEDAADSLLEADRPDGVTSNADDGLVELDIDGDGSDSVSPEDSMNLYNFFNILNTFSTLPAPDDFIDSIPKSRTQEVEKQLLDATVWLNRMQTLWEQRDD